LIRLAAVPSDLARYYPNEYYELPSLQRLAKIAAADPFKIDLVRRFAARGRLMEIGPAQGVFAFQAKRAGFDVDVIEMDSRCCDHLNNVVGVNAIWSAAPHDVLPTLKSYDVIALWHVIEHVPDPWALLNTVAQSLVPGGILVIATPNPDAWQFRIMCGAWPHLDAPRHLYLLPATVLTPRLVAAGLERVHCTSTDRDAKRWNRFGWQRLLMNRMPGRWSERAGYVAGLAISAALAPFEAGGMRGSAYTVVFRKS
jgi:2-polyprenyl-3-methyl-5-hydroxy-6-metoxy-1,4-benzoquinol methylase